MPKIPSMSSKDFIRMLEKGGAVFVRQGPTDHAIYSRIIDGQRFSAPVHMGEEVIRSYLLQKGLETAEIHRRRNRKTTGMKFISSMITTKSSLSPFLSHYDIHVNRILKV